MATATLYRKTLKVTYDGGVVDGKAVTMSKVYGQIHEACTDGQLLALANLINDLQSKTVLGIRKTEESDVSA